ncbi:MAG TPA: FAD-dependent monooxygenase [Terriglobales bacterium]|nr:FAD-dependent monooxygenase [Terriglobales bacterium]
MADIEVPVFIVGGSLVGLSTALLLGYHGVRSLAVEYHRGTAIHPRAAQTSQRTMEIFRQVGLEQIVRRKSEEQFVQDGGVLAVETLVGGAIAHYIADLNEGVRDVSPTARVFLAQDALEPQLRERAEELGADLRFATEMVWFEQDTNGVSAVIRERDSGKTQTVRAQYMVAADGAYSRVRERLGIRMLGHGTFSKSITIYFRAHLAPLIEGHKWAVVYALNRQLRGFFRFEKPFEKAFLAVNTVGEPENPVTDVSTGLTEQRSLELVRAAIGTDSIPIAIENIMHWKASADTAEVLQDGRVFIAGDAAHVMPPNGGFGGNTGVQDAHNLAWKLALVLKGIAGPGLLSTYGPERHPPGAFTVEQAYSRYVLRTAPNISRDGLQPVAPDLNVEMGYIYHSNAIVPEDRDDSSAHENPRESKGRPGTRAPHVWLQRRGEQISTLDLFGRNFTLLAGPQGNAWTEAARDRAKPLGIELDVHKIGENGLTDPSGGCPAAYGITPTGAVLVRPDGFVAWRVKIGDSASAEGIKSALATLLCRPVEV